MPTFILLTRVSPDSVEAPRGFQVLEEEVAERVGKACPELKWIANYALTGPYDYLDIFTAPDLESAMRVSALVRSYGRSHSELWPAVEWKAFKSMVSRLQPV